VVINRVGSEGKLNFWGQSFVVDPLDGSSPKQLPTKKKYWWSTAISTRSKRRDRTGRFLRDRRIDAYQGLTYVMLISHEI